MRNEKYSLSCDAKGEAEKKAWGTAKKRDEEGFPPLIEMVCVGLGWIG